MIRYASRSRFFLIRIFRLQRNTLLLFYCFVVFFSHFFSCFPYTFCAADFSEMACSISFNFSRLMLWQFFDIYFWSGATVVKRFLKWILSATFLKNKQRWRAEIFRDDRRSVCLVQQCHTCKNVRRQYRLSPEGNKKIDLFNFFHF